MTGANYLLEFGSVRVLVDCGLFQGSKYAEELSYAPFKYDPKSINYVFITHSHTDHIGRLPKLYKDGFRGKIYVVEPTKDLIAAALPDNARIMAEEAKAEGHTPLYSLQDIEAMMGLVEGVKYHQKIELINEGRRGTVFASSRDKNFVHRSPLELTAEFLNAGHILGSAIVCFRYQEEGAERKIYFTGDLGNSPSLLLPDKEFVEDADYAVVESAYGDRVHEDVDQRSQIFREVVEHIVRSRGTLMIPSFAIERTQEMLFEINKLLNTSVIPHLPVFIDSPLATKMTEVYSQYPDYLKKEAHQFGKNIFNFPGLRYTETVADSKSINDIPSPKIIIAGSGMSNGGRILHHEKRYLSDPNSAIVFVGYQVDGSLGRKILDGQKEVMIFGEKVSVNCFVKGIGGYSAHADQSALAEWVRRAGVAGNPSASSGRSKLRKVFVVQGEESSAKALAEVIKNQVYVDTVVPTPEQEFEL